MNRPESGDDLRNGIKRHIGDGNEGGILRASYNFPVEEGYERTRLQVNLPVGGILANGIGVGYQHDGVATCIRESEYGISLAGRGSGLGGVIEKPQEIIRIGALILKIDRQAAALQFGSEEGRIGLPAYSDVILEIASECSYKLAISVFFDADTDYELPDSIGETRQQSGGRMNG